MRTILLLTAFVFVNSICSGAETKENDETQVQPTPPIRRPLVATVSQRETKIFPLQYISAKTAAGKVNQHAKSLNITAKLDGFVIDSPLVVIPDSRANALIVSCYSEYLPKLTELINEVDKHPTLISIKSTITVIDANGEETIVSRPQVMTIDGDEAIIEIGGKNSTTYRFQLTPKLIDAGQFSRVAEQPDKQSRTR